MVGLEQVCRNCRKVSPLPLSSLPTVTIHPLQEHYPCSLKPQSFESPAICILLGSGAHPKLDFEDKLEDFFIASALNLLS